MKVRILIIFSGYGRTEENMQKEPKSWQYYGMAWFTFFFFHKFIFIQIEVQHYYRFICHLTSANAKSIGLDVWAWKWWLSLNKAKKSFKFVKYDHDFISNWAIKLGNQIKNVKKWIRTDLCAGLPERWKYEKRTLYVSSMPFGAFSVDSAFAN